MKELSYAILFIIFFFWVFMGLFVAANVEDKNILKHKFKIFLYGPFAWFIIIF